jgi:hypothetical protein
MCLRPRPLVQKKTWRDSLPIDMLISAVSVLVVAQSISEISEGLMNNPVLYLFLMTAFPYSINVHWQTSLTRHSWCFQEFAPVALLERQLVAWVRGSSIFVGKGMPLLRWRCAYNCMEGEYLKGKLSDISRSDSYGFLFHIFSLINLHYF